MANIHTVETVSDTSSVLRRRRRVLRIVLTTSITIALRTPVSHLAPSVLFNFTRTFIYWHLKCFPSFCFATARAFIGIFRMLVKLTLPYLYTYFANV